MYADYSGMAFHLPNTIYIIELIHHFIHKTAMLGTFKVPVVCSLMLTIITIKLHVLYSVHCMYMYK